MELGTTEIMDIIPHRYPFLMVDRIVSMEPGEEATGIKQVSASDPHLQGHFPGHPVMPGVLITEAMAQVGAVALLCLPEHKGRLGFLAGLDKVRFKRQVVPGDTLYVHCRLEKFRRGVGVAQARAWVGDDDVATARITFALGSAPKDS